MISFYDHVFQYPGSAKLLPGWFIITGHISSNN